MDSGLSGSLTRKRSSVFLAQPCALPFSHGVRRVSWGIGAYYEFPLFLFKISAITERRVVTLWISVLTSLAVNTAQEVTRTGVPWLAGSRRSSGHGCQGSFASCWRAAPPSGISHTAPWRMWWSAPSWGENFFIPRTGKIERNPVAIKLLVPVLVVDLVPESRRVDNRQPHLHALLFDDCKKKKQSRKWRRVLKKRKGQC